MKNNLSELEQLREATREARETLKDLKAIHKEIKETVTEWKTELAAEMTEYIKKEMNGMGDDFYETTEKS